MVHFMPVLLENRGSQWDHFYGLAGKYDDWPMGVGPFGCGVFPKSELLRLSIDRVIDSLLQILFRRTVKSG